MQNVLVNRQSSLYISIREILGVMYCEVSGRYLQSQEQTLLQRKLIEGNIALDAECN